MSIITLHERNSFFQARHFPTSQPKEVPIELDSVFWGGPEGPRSVDYSILLDTNVFSFISKAPHAESVQGLVTYAKAQGLPLDPSYALIEQRLRHGNPRAAMERYAESLRKNFGFTLPHANVNEMDAQLAKAVPVLTHNIELLRDLLPLVKLIWRAKGDFASKVQRLVAAMQSQDLPRFITGYLFAVVTFYVKHYRDRFPPRLASKLDSDMAVANTPSAEQDALWNLAFDMSMPTFCIEAALRESTPNLLYLNQIASADRSFAVYARNIKANAISRSRLDPSSGLRSNGQWGLVPDADLDDETRGFAMHQFKADPPKDSKHSTARRANLSRLAAAIVAGNPPPGI